MDYKLELVLIPVADVDRAKKFYLENAGFALIVDAPIGQGQRVVQVIPPGSACAIGFGTGITSAAPGSAQGLHLVVPDIVAARAEMAERGVAIGPVRHMVNGEWAQGPHPERENYQSFADFSDPDGNIWLLQEVGRRGLSWLIQAPWLMRGSPVHQINRITPIDHNLCRVNAPLPG